MCQNTTMWVNGAWIKYITLYVQKHITPCTVVITSLLVRDKPLEAPASVKRSLLEHSTDKKQVIPPPPPTHTHTHFNSSLLGQNGRHFADDIFKCIFVNQNVWILLKVSLKFIPKCQQYYSIDSYNGLVLTSRQAMIWNNECKITDAYMRHSASKSRYDRENEHFHIYIFWPWWRTNISVSIYFRQIRFYNNDQFSSIMFVTFQVKYYDKYIFAHCIANCTGVWCC